VWLTAPHQNNSFTRHHRKVKSSWLGYIDVFSNSTGSDEVLQICLSLVQKLNSVYSMRSTRFVFGETLWKTTTTVHANSVPLLRTIAINLVHQRRKEIARRIDAILGQ
jgi:hypothetical protein